MTDVLTAYQAAVYLATGEIERDLYVERDEFVSESTESIQVDVGRWIKNARQYEKQAAELLNRAREDRLKIYRLRPDGSSEPIPTSELVTELHLFIAESQLGPDLIRKFGSTFPYTDVRFLRSEIDKSKKKRSHNSHLRPKVDEKVEAALNAGWDPSVHGSIMKMVAEIRKTVPEAKQAEDSTLRKYVADAGKFYQQKR
jgi:hypothetical protein